MSPQSKLRPSLSFLVALACALVAVGFAAAQSSAAVFTVNENLDRDDIQAALGTPADGNCDAGFEGGSQCSLRAAIQEANATPARDQIDFDPGMSGKQLTLDITRGATAIALDVTQPVSIDACSHTASPTAPCFGLRAPVRTLNGRGIDVLDARASNVALSGFAITNANQGVFVSGANFVLRNTYLGADLSQAIVGNDNAIFVAGDGATIGGSFAGQGNWITAAGTGLRIAGDNSVIQGNLIGPTSLAGTGSQMSKGILLQALNDNRPANTLIGGTLSDAERATPACDGPCNVISGDTAIDLGTDDGSGGVAAEGVTIAGNNIGLNKAGDDRLSTLTGVAAGDALDVTVGGAPASRNVISTGGNGILADRGKNAGLLISDNFLGTDGAGTGSLSTLTIGGGAILRSVPGDPAVVRANLVAIGQGYGIQVQGRNAEVTGNQVGISLTNRDMGSSGSDSYGIGVVGTGTIDSRDNTIAANTIGHGWLAGVLVRGADSNQIDSNRIGAGPTGTAHGNVGFGIRIERFAGTPATSEGNRIGGDTPGSVNAISNNPKGAIAVGPGNAGNSIVGFRGTNNSVGSQASGTFLDLGINGPGNPGIETQLGIQAPTVAFAGSTQVVGAGTPGAVVRLYEKPGSAAGDVDGQGPMLPATVGADGVWSGGLTGPVDPGTIVTATQTFADAGTSELADPVSVSAGEGDGTAPETTISGPAVTNDTTPAIALGGSAESAYLCRADGGAWRACGATWTPGPLLDGVHALEAKAISADGLLDPTPATLSVTVDTVAPAAPAIVSGPAGATPDTRPAFGFTGDAGASFFCAFDDAPPTACVSGVKPLAPLGTGPHAFTVWAADAAGNVGPAAKRTFTVTNGGDVPGGGSADTRIDKAPKKVRAKRRAVKVKVRFSSPAAGATFLCKVDKQPEAPCASPLKLKLKRGKHLFSVRAVDPSGAADSTPATARIRVTA